MKPLPAQPPLPGVFPFSRGDRVRVARTRLDGPWTRTFIKAGPWLEDGAWLVEAVGVGVVPVENVKEFRGI